MKRILFVDDEPALLQAMRFSLRPWRDRWEMVFVSGAAEAFVELARAPFDVVVSDMRMPGVDGAELLRRIAAGWPGSARLLLSGFADPDALARAQQVAQRCLDKPCELDVLSAAIETAIIGAAA